MGLRQGRNSWSLSEAKNIKILIDAEDYFRDLYETLSTARRRILILGWEISDDVHLTDIATPGADPSRLNLLLLKLVRESPELEVNILIWDAFPFFVSHRQPRTAVKAAYRHPRMTVRFHRRLPTFSSFHEKVVTIDDRIAYCGGIDLVSTRWDNPKHSSSGSSQEGRLPIHDVQIRIEGDAARDMAALARDDWEKATGIHLDAIDPYHAEISEPSGDLKRADCERSVAAISRTRAIHGFCPSIREVERIYIDLIGLATRQIYIECQYLSAESIVAALSESLAKKRGPEVVIVTSCRHHGWWEKRTLGSLRNEAMKTLKACDRFGRFGIFYPATPDSESGVKVHSKLMIIDETYLCIGSSNLTNRSFGLDSECALTLDATFNDAAMDCIKWMKSRLLGEHLNLRPEDVQAGFSRLGSMLALINERSSEARALRQVQYEDEDWIARWLKTRKWSDPGSQLRGEALLYKFIQWLGGRRSLLPPSSQKSRRPYEHARSFH